MSWNRNDWQGRSEENVRFSNTVAAIAIAGLIVTIIICGIISLL